MKTAHYILIACAGIVLWAIWYSRKDSASENYVVPPYLPPTGEDDGRTGNDNGLTPIGTGNTGIAPVNVLFEDFAAMRFIGNDGRAPLLGSRKLADKLYNATGFLVKQGVNLSMFKIGEPVSVAATANNTNPHFETGIHTIKAKIPAIPGVSTQIRGTWVVTDGSWTDGASGKERGTLKAL